MIAEFVNPNWHVILIHYPMALLTLGFLMETASWAWDKAGFRIAGRWMILAGVLHLARSYRKLAGVLCVLIVIALPLEVWLGTLMLYDSHSGPLYRFAGADAKAGQHHHAGEARTGSTEETPATAGHAGTTQTAPGTPGDKTQPRIAQVVTMTRDLRYSPEKAIIHEGDTVEWRNTSETDHTVTAITEEADDPSHVVLPPGAEPFGSGLMRPGDTFHHTFTGPGDYTYLCIPHEAMGMIGELEVKPKADSR